MTTPTRFRVTESSNSLWRITFHNPPLNLIDSVMIGELNALFSRIEASETVAVVVFDSADPDFFLAHYDVAEIANGDAEQVGAPPDQPHPWLTTLARLNTLPAVTISSSRGRARGAGSEFVIATDLRFASREKAVLGQFEIGVGAIPGGGPASRLPALVGRGRAFEILFGGGDFDGDLAERYGYVNRALPDAELDGFVDAFANRVSKFDVQAIRDIKKFVNVATLRPENELAEQIDAYFAAAGRPASASAHEQLFAAGLQQRSDVEYNLGEWIGKLSHQSPTTPPKAVGHESENALSAASTHTRLKWLQPWVWIVD
jgi:enoyl-CoA hydratase/carnithine racemase